MKLLPCKTKTFGCKVFFFMNKRDEISMFTSDFPTKFYLSYRSQLIFNTQTFPPTV